MTDPGPDTTSNTTPGNPFLILVAAASFMVVLDFTIVNVALPSIGTELGMTPTSLQWVVSAYALTFGGFLLLGGRLGDLLGRARLFQAGLLLFVAGSLAGGVAVNGGVLVAARAVQGLGAAALAPASLSLLTSSYPQGPARDRALGIYGAITTTGFSAGAVLGGALVSVLSWRWVFFVNVPLGLLAYGVGRRVLPRDPRTGATVDVMGAGLVTAAMAVLVYAPSRAEQAGWAAPQPWLLLALAAVLTIAFLAWERRTAAPLIRLTIFRSRPVSGANTIMILVGAWTAAQVLVITLLLQQLLGWSALSTGLAFLPQGIAAFAVARLAPVLLRRCGERTALLAATVAATAALTGMAWTAGQRYTAGLILFSVLLGGANSVLAVVITSTGSAGVAAADQGLAGGLLNATRQIGSALGVAVISAVLGSAAASAGPERYRSALLVAAALGFAAAAITVVVLPRRRPVTEPSAVPTTTTP